MSEGAPLLQLRGIAKSYGAHRVLSGVDLQLDRGESIALIGENGAGKSTFSRILTGVAQPDEGEILLDGERVSFSAPRAALAKGIAFIPQELAYLPDMSVAENILLNQWPARAGMTRRAASIRRAEEECRRYGIDLGDLSRRMGDLKLADRQIAEIAKALTRRARLIVLDEPTAALSEAESRALFAILGRLNAEGVGIIYISHRMDEVFGFSHRVAVLRNGSVVAVRRPSETTPGELIADMLGQAAGEAVHRGGADAARGEPVLRLADWRHGGTVALHGVSLEIGHQEIVGLYGLRGSGTDLLAEGLGGLRPEMSGELVLNGIARPPFRSPLEARRAGVAYLPAERKRNGLVLGHAIRNNLSAMVLKRLSRFGFLRQRAERRAAGDVAKRFDVRCRSIEQPVGELSGGNQQKVLLASRMAADPDVLVLHEPTRGVDVGARVQIHHFLSENASRGCATLLVTSDLEEAVAISDRLLVMREGRIVGTLTGAGKTQGAAVALAAGQDLDPS
ncbi:sugar ABC transporter ATP-binding protein [Aureimonas sp. AU20]|uniref:sugar ABC transporter ATP-binding protein n=1 Tax=Aureimonas sp. AU20 TaxID=1349819 RepID=UPI0007225E2F|nr:sugar ABC transporter ATP-binding protein [Aureimonas sp. AU20]ALN75055.1 hypothetical protein M673_20205 [Aureimonas sp. AU20]